MDSPEGRLLHEPTVLGAMLRSWWIVGLAVALCMGLAYALASQQSRSFIGEAALIVQDPRASTLFDQTQIQRPERYVQDQVEIIRSTVVAERAGELLSESELAPDLTPNQLLGGLSVADQPNSDLIVISFAWVSADGAVAGANAIAQAYQDVRRSEAIRSFARPVDELDASIAEIEDEVAALQDQVEELRRSDPVRNDLVEQYEDDLAELASMLESAVTDPDRLGDMQLRLQLVDLVRRLEAQQPRLATLLGQQTQALDRLADLTALRDQLRVDAQLAGGGVELYSPAVAAILAESSLVRFLAVGLVLGAILGASVAYLLALSRNRFTDRREPALVLDSPLLGSVPDFKHERLRTPLPARDAPLSAAAESVRFIATALSTRSTTRQELHSGEVGSLAVVSASRGDGKSIVLANIAIAAVLQGWRVLVIDADFGHQNVTEFLLPNTPPGPGLTEVVTGSLSLSEAAIRVDLPRTDLFVLSRGRLPVTAPDFFNSERTREFFKDGIGGYDLVLIDTPPLLQVAYTMKLVDMSDLVLAVVPHGSNVTALEEFSQRLKLAGAPMVGYVYNRSDDRLRTGEGSLADVLGTIQTEPTRRHVGWGRGARVRAFVRRSWERITARSGRRKAAGDSARATNPPISSHDRPSGAGDQ